MIEFLKSETAFVLSWFFGAIGGFAAIWFFWEKIFAGIKWIVNKFKNALALFKETPTNPFGDKGRIENPSRFFEQKKLLNKVFCELEKGTSLSLIGNKQTGKSSLLYHISEKEPHFIYLDMQTVHDEGDFFKALCSEMDIPESRGYALHRALQGKHYVLCLDHIERMTNKLFSGDEQIELRGLAGSQDAPLTLILVPKFYLGMPFATRSVAGRRASLNGFPNRVWEPEYQNKKFNLFPRLVYTKIVILMKRSAYCT
jgi:hypothetical protein